MGKKNGMSVALAQTREELRTKLVGFLKQCRGWHYGTFTDDKNNVHDGNLQYKWGCWIEGDGYIPPHLEVSFWRHAPGYVHAGRRLNEEMLFVPAQFMAEFLSKHPRMGCRTEVVVPWAVTYRIYAKTSKPRKLCPQ